VLASRCASKFSDRSVTTGLLAPMKRSPDTTEPESPVGNEPQAAAGPRRSKRVKRVTAVVPDLEDIVTVVRDSSASGIDVSSRSKSARTAMKGTKTPRQSKVTRQLGTPHPAPAKWRETYDLITHMRSRELADVDTTGCQLAQEGETDPVVSYRVHCMFR
jgi:endonuclease III